MKFKATFFAAVLLIISFAAASATALEDILAKQVEADIQPAGEAIEKNSALRRLAVALSSGREAMRAFHGSQIENNNKKDPLNPPIAGMECSIDRIAGYISCYSPLIDPEEAETLFTRLIDELQAALPSDRWKGIKKEPGISSIRSYAYEDQKSNAHIDIDILARPGLGRQSSYMISIFGWTR